MVKETWRCCKGRLKVPVTSFHMPSFATLQLRSLYLVLGHNTVHHLWSYCDALLQFTQSGHVTTTPKRDTSDATPRRVGEF
jgi:hypothetical protein